MRNGIVASIAVTLVLLAAGSAAAQGEQASILQVECIHSVCDIRGPGRTSPFMRGPLAPEGFSYRLDQDSIETEADGRMQVRFSNPRIPKTRELVSSLGDTAFRVQEKTSARRQALVVLLSRGTIKVVREGDREVRVDAGPARIVLLGTTVIVFYDPVLGVVEVLVVDGTAQVQNPAVGGPILVSAGGRARVGLGVAAQTLTAASPGEIAAALEPFDVIGDFAGPVATGALPLNDRAPLDPAGPPGDPGARGRAEQPFPQPKGVLDAVGLGIDF
jgi:hypothetical protein